MDGRFATFGSLPSNRRIALLYNTNDNDDDVDDDDY